MSMSALELLVPLVLICALGHALLRLIAPTVNAIAVERWALAFVLGIGGVSLLAWWLRSPLFVVVRPTWKVAAAILAIVAAAFFVKAVRPQSVPEAASTEHWTISARALAAILITLSVLVVIVSLVTPLGWDGLINFEFKARIGFLNEPSGVIPDSYFADSSRSWSHQRYPLLVPAVEGWLYQWMGEPDQEAIKVLFPLFYLSLFALFFSAVRQFLSTTGTLVACLGFALIPAFTVGPGGATTGYADVPLTAFVFGAVHRTRVALATGGRHDMRLAAVLAGLAAWTKAEGVCLAACLIGAVIIARCVAPSKRAEGSTGSTYFVMLLTIVPLMVIGPWWVFNQIQQTVPNGDFMSVTPANIAANLSRVPSIADLIGREFLRAGRWAALWPAFAVMGIICLRHLRRPLDCIVTAMVVIPLVLYMFMYMLSAWPSLGDHVATSLPRLLLPLGALAWLGTVGHLREALNWSAHPVDLEPAAESKQLVAQSAALS